MFDLARKAAFAKALVEVQKILGATRVSSTSFWDVCYGPLTINELAISQTIQMGDGKVTITTTLEHAAGHREEHRTDVKPVAGVRLGQLVELFAFRNLTGALGLLVPNEDSESVFTEVTRNPINGA